jgi:hypothetical protein
VTRKRGLTIDVNKRDHAYVEIAQRRAILNGVADRVHFCVSTFEELCFQMKALIFS